MARLTFRRILLRLLLGLALALLAAAVSLYVTLTSTRFEERLRHHLLTYIEQAAGSPVTIEALEIQPLRLEAALRGVAGELKGGGRLRARRIEARIDPWSLVAASPRLDVLAIEGGFLEADLETLPGAGMVPSRVALPRSLTLLDTELHLRRGDVRVDVADLAGSVAGSDGDARFTLTFALTHLLLDGRELAPGHLRLQGLLTARRRLALDRLAGSLRTGPLDIRGDIDLDAGAFDLRGRVAVETAALSSILREPGVASGEVLVVGRLVGPLRSPRVVATVEAEQVVIKGLPFRALSGDLAVGRRGLTLVAGSAQLFDGDVQFRGSLPFPPRAAEVTFRATDADLSLVPAAVPGFPFVGGIAAAEGTLHVGGPEKLRIDALTRFRGVDSVLGAGMRDPRLRLVFAPAEGTATLHVSRGEIEVREADVTSAWGGGRLSGRVRPGGPLALELELAESDLAAVSRVELVSVPWREAPLAYRLAGALTGRVTLTGTTRDPLLHADLTAPFFVLTDADSGPGGASAPFEDGRLWLEYAGRRIRWEATAAGSARVRADGDVSIPVEPRAPEHAFRLSTTDWDLGRLARLVEVPFDATGQADLSASIRLLGDGVHGEVTGSLRGTVLGHEVATREVRVALTPVRSDLLALEATVAGGTLRSSGLLRGAAGETALDVSLEGLPLAALLGASGWPIGGSATLSGRLNGPLAAPHGEASLTLSGLTARDESLGDLEGTLSLDPALLRIALGRSGIEIELRATPRSPFPFEVSATFRDLPLAPLSPLLLPPALARTAGAATGSLRASGTAYPELAFTDGKLSIAAAHATLGGLEVATIAPFEAALVDPGSVSITGLKLRGPESALEIEGRVGLGDRASDVRVAGTTDLRLLRAFVPDVAVSGPLRLDLHLLGTTTEPRIEGSASLAEGYFRTALLPYPLRDVTGRVAFQGSSASLTELRARFGGGQIQADGTIEFARSDAPSLRLHATGEDVRLTLLGDLEVRANPDLTYELTKEGRSIQGTLRVTRATYSARSGLPSGIGRAGGLAAGSEALRGLPETRLALRVLAEGNVWLVSSDIRVQGDAALTIGGTTSEPVVLGRVSYLSQEKLVLQGRRYQIVRGSLTFDNPAVIDPRLDLVAETELQGIDVVLQVTGPLSSPQVTARSDPPLPQSDVFSLLVGGTAQEGGEAVVGPRGEEVLRSLFLPRALSRLTGGYFTVDVPALRGKADPTEVLPIAIRPAEDWDVIVGVPLREARPSLVVVNWRPFHAVSFTATRDLDRAFGLEAGWERRFGERRASDTQEPSVASVRVEGVEDALRARLTDRVHTRAGRPLSRERLREDVERLTAVLRDDGYPFARARARVEPVDGGSGGADVTLTVETGPPVRIEISGMPPDRKLKERLAETVQSFGLYGETASELERTTRTALEERGFARSVVSCEQRNPEAITIVCAIEPGRRYEIETLAIAGNAHVAADRLRPLLRTRKGLFHEARLVTPAIEDDAASIRAFYYDLGYLRASARAEVRDGGAPDKLELIFHVVEGPLFRARSVVIEGSSEVPAATLHRAIRMKPGDALEAAAMRADRDALFRVYDDLGYMDAVVRLERRELAPAESGAADVAFRITEGLPARVGVIRVEGVARTRESLVRRELRFRSGGLVGYTRVAASQRALYDLGIFRSVEIVAEPVPEEPALRDVVVRVEEAAPYRLQLGGGFDSKQGVRGLFEIADSNFTGRARYVGLQLRAAGNSARAQVLFREPRPLGLDLPSFLTTYYERRQEVSFDLRRLAFRLESTLSLDARNRSRVLLRYSLSDTSLDRLLVSPLEAGAEDLRISSIGVALVRDTRDDVLDPHRGYLASGDVEWAQRALGSQADFTKLTLKAYRYVALRPRLVWAAAAQVGLGFPGARAAERLPLAERYFAGGATSLRGFAFNEAGPQDPETGRPTGGSGVVVLNQELRYDLFWNLIGSVFVDAGNVYRQVSDLRRGDLRWSAGAGLRYRGPIIAGIDYARLLARRPGEDRGQVHFSLGYAF